MPITVDNPVSTERWSWNPGSICGFTGYKTNKFDLKHRQEEGGWIVAWSDDISETDVAAGVVSIFGSPAAFAVWAENLVNRTLSSLAEDASKKFPDEIKSQIIQLTKEVIQSAIEGKDAKQALKKYDTVDFKAGAIRYSGKNVLCGNTVSNTWGMKPYIGFRWH